MLNRFRQIGVSLVELVVVLTILAVSVALAAPAYSNWMRQSEIRGNAESIVAGIQFARTEAVRRNQWVSFSLVAGADPGKLDDSCALSARGSSWVVSLDDPSGKCAAAPSDSAPPRTLQSHASGAVASKLTLGASIATDPSIPATQITFNGLGQVLDPRTQIGRLELSDAGGSVDVLALRITVTANGAVRMCVPGITDLGDPRRC